MISLPLTRALSLATVERKTSTLSHVSGTESRTPGQEKKFDDSFALREAMNELYQALGRYSSAKNILPPLGVSKEYTLGQIREQFQRFEAFDPLTEVLLTETLSGHEIPFRDSIMETQEKLWNLLNARSEEDQNSNPPSTIFRTTKSDDQNLRSYEETKKINESEEILRQDTGESKREKDGEASPLRLQQVDSKKPRQKQIKKSKKKHTNKKFDLVQGGISSVKDPEKGAEDSEDLEKARFAFYGTDGEEEGGELGDESALNEIAEVAEDIEHALSSHQKYKKALEETMVRQERALLAPKPWQLQGEVSLAQRPKDSLLDENFELEYGLKQPPVYTLEMTATLETLIKDRIRNQLFDDVEQKKEETFLDEQEENDPTLEIEGTKHEFTLSELYEKRYLETLKSNPNTPTMEKEKELTQLEQDELKALEMWKKLSRNLDLLANGCAPKPSYATKDDLHARVAKGNEAIAFENIPTIAPCLMPETDLPRPPDPVVGTTNEEGKAPKWKKIWRGTKKKTREQKKQRLRVD